jgi:phosphoglycolate phosphatase-like HAD superfamily hydrolase
MIPRRVWLFDIDGTLLWTDGAAREAYAWALEHQLGLRDDLHDIAFAGRTDPVILASILARHGRTLTTDESQAFHTALYGRMRTVLQPGRGRVLPGVAALLERVAAEPAWTSALLTGNNAEMARIKLDHFGLSPWFAFGAFGDEAADRNALACVAVDRARERMGARPSDCIVIGDTEHDIACARASGAWAIAVATGQFGADHLARHDPDLLVEDLTDTETVLRFVRGLPA